MDSNKEEMRTPGEIFNEVVDSNLGKPLDEKVLIAMRSYVKDQNKSIIEQIEQIRLFMQSHIPPVQSGFWPQWLDIRDKLQDIVNENK